MNSELKELKPELNPTEQELLFRIMLSAEENKTKTLAIPVSFIKDLYPEVEEAAFPEHIINILVKFMNLPVLIDRNYVPLISSFNSGRENVIVQFSDAVFKSGPNKIFQTVIENYCNPYKRSFYYRQSD